MGKKGQRLNHSEFPILDGLNLYASATKGDGNCLFRALSDQIHGDESKHYEIRQAVVTYVKENADHFAAFIGEYGETFEQYISRLSQDGVYGGHIEIVGFAAVYGKQVVIYQSENLYVVQPEGRSKAELKGAVHIAYHSWEHYSSVRQIGGPRTGPVHLDIALNDSALANIDVGSTTDSDDIPAWKVNIVMSSVPDAQEDKVIEMLKTKDYDLVIEDLLMAEYREPEVPKGSLPEANESGNQAQSSSTACKAKAEEPPKNEKTVQQNSMSDKSEPSPTAAPGSIQDKKLAAKERRNAKKERVRAKKHKPKAIVPDNEKDSSHSKSTESTNTKLDLKIVHI